MFFALQKLQDIQLKDDTSALHCVWYFNCKSCDGILEVKSTIDDFRMRGRYRLPDYIFLYFIVPIIMDCKNLQLENIKCQHCDTIDQGYETPVRMPGTGNSHVTVNLQGAKANEKVCETINYPCRDKGFCWKSTRHQRRRVNQTLVIRGLAASFSHFGMASKLNQVMFVVM